MQADHLSASEQKYAYQIIIIALISFLFHKTITREQYNETVSWGSPIPADIPYIIPISWQGYPLKSGYPCLGIYPGYAVPLIF